MTGSILCLNAGSSSLKFAVFGARAGEPASLRGEIDGIPAEPCLTARDASGSVLVRKTLPTGFDGALQALLDLALSHGGAAGLRAVGHRVVHGGTAHTASEVITPAVLTALVALTPLDPLHMPGNLAPIRAIAALRPATPQVVCFDTAFHAMMPEVARRIALPRAITGQCLRRFGFHGLSCEFIAARLAETDPGLVAGRVIVAHLGSGASLCALKGGQSIETTTGFSALDGLMMATRCGSIDPGVILHLARQGHSVAQIEDMLYHRSGLLGVSGISNDIRVLLASREIHAREAVELFTYRIATQAGALVSALGGLDGLVFTAGIGAHSPEVRSEVCARLAWLGVRLDEPANRADANRISRPDSLIDVRVIPTDEEVIIARHIRTLLPAFDRQPEHAA